MSSVVGIGALVQETAWEPLFEAPWGTSDRRPTLAWWALISALQLVNGWLLYRATRQPDCKWNQMLCALCYVFASATRSIWPRIDVERICFWDATISTPFIGRSMATVAELCFVQQIVWVMQEMRLAPTFTNWSLPTLCVAEAVSWAGVLTQNQSFNMLEESLWTVTMFSAALSCTFTYLRGREARGEAILTWRVLANLGNYDERLCAAYWCGLLGNTFVAFMVLVDVPMYFKRWLSEGAAGTPAAQQYLTLSEGLADSMQCSLVSRNWSVWQEDVPWMTLYFTVTVWISIRMVLPWQKFALLRAASTQLNKSALESIPTSQLEKDKAS